MIDNSLERIISINTASAASSPAPPAERREESNQQRKGQSLSSAAMSLRYLHAPRQVATAVEAGSRRKGDSKVQGHQGKRVKMRRRGLYRGGERVPRVHITVASLVWGLIESATGLLAWGL